MMLTISLVVNKKKMTLIAEDHFYTLTRIHKKKQKDHKDQRDNLCIKVVLN